MQIEFFLFWISLAGIFHTYVFYFLTLKLWGLFLRRPNRSCSYTDETWPSVTLLVPVHNEESILKSKLMNIFQLEYPREKLSVLVCSDRSTDATVAIASSFSRVQVRDLQERSGKTGVLNKTIPSITSELVVITDADTMMEPDALKKVVNHFSDPPVGGVSGNILVLSEDRTVGETLYRSYESRTKVLESHLDSIIGAHGGFNAFRTRLYKVMPANTIVDDMIISLSIIGQGYRFLFEPEARATEQSQSLWEEYRRRVRIGKGNFQTVAMEWHYLLPWKGFVSYAFWSHKILRWLTPFFLAIVFTTSTALALRGELFYVIVAMLLGASLLLSSGFTALGGSGKTKVGKVLFYMFSFYLMNFALLVGFWEFLKGIDSAVWQPTRRK